MVQLYAHHDVALDCDNELLFQYFEQILCLQRTNVDCKF